MSRCHNQISGPSHCDIIATENVQIIPCKKDIIKDLTFILIFKKFHTFSETQNYRLPKNTRPSSAEVKERVEM